jgi:hypothetical protein
MRCDKINEECCGFEGCVDLSYEPSLLGLKSMVASRTYGEWSPLWIG